MLNAQKTDVYTDFDGLAKLRNEAKKKTPEAIKEVAKQFESVFVGMMLKSMRQVKLADGILDSNQSDFYRDMYDQQLSIHLAGKGGIGLADLIEKQLIPDQSSLVVKNQQIADYERQSKIIGLALKNIDSRSTANTEVNKKTEKIKHNLDTSILLADSAESFVSQLRPYAEQAARKLGVDAEVLLAQAALETGWGKSVIKAEDGSNSYNLFNIKADKSWQGRQAKVATLEFRDGVAKKEMAGFRAYHSYQQSFDDYVDFIKSNPRYATALTKVQQPEQYMQELQQAGYATDPDYAEKVMKIYQSNVITTQAPNAVAVQQRSALDQS